MCPIQECTRVTAPSAVENLLRESAPRVYNLCYSILGSHEDAEDCCQEVLLKVYQGFDGYRGEAAVTTWIYRIAVNACKNRIRSASRRGAALRLVSEPADERYSPALQSERRHTAHRIRACICALPPRKRMLVVLRDIEGRSYGEISRILGVAMGTVKSRLARARHALMRLLEEEAL